MWQSKWSGGAAQPPHWLIIDLGQPLNLVKIELYRRVGAVVDTKTVQLSVSNDPNPDGTWKSIGMLNYSGTVGDDLRTLDITPDTDTDGRYLKLYLPDSNRFPYVQLAEIYIYVGN
jgi:hypothetical protein